MPATHLEDARALGFDVWTEHPRESFDARVPANLRAQLDASGLPYVVLDADLDATVDAERLRLRGGSTHGGVIDPDPQGFFDEYQPLDRIEAHLVELAELRPERVTAREIGRSFEDRPLHALEITAADDDAPVFLLDSGQHAREWIAIASTTCVLDRLVRDAYEPRVDALLQTYRFVVVPIVNPDGYVHSWDDDRFWRKNRRPPNGVDLNRNFSAVWGGPGSSDDPKAGNYRGESALSEPESQAIDALAAEQPPFIHVDVHAYGQLVLYPWGHDGALPPDHDVLRESADVLAMGFSALYDQPYTPLSGSDFYPASGNIMDWGYAQWGAYAFGIELRPLSNEEGGFVIPPEQIELVCDELWEGVIDLAEHLEDAEPLRPVEPPPPMPAGGDSSSGGEDTGEVGGDTSSGGSSSGPDVQGTGGGSSASPSGRTGSSTGDTAHGTGDAGSNADDPAGQGCGCTTTRWAANPLWMLVLIGIRRRRTSRQRSSHQ